MSEKFFTIFGGAALIFCLIILFIFVFTGINLSFKPSLNQPPKERFNKGIHIHININHPNITNTMSNAFINAGVAVGVAAGGVGAGFVRCGDGSSQTVVNHKSDSINSGTSANMASSSIHNDRVVVRSRSRNRSRIRIRPRAKVKLRPSSIDTNSSAKST